MQEFEKLGVFYLGRPYEPAEKERAGSGLGGLTSGTTAEKQAKAKTEAKTQAKAESRTEDGWLLYDSRDLVTHAVCVGMTGSGKTGLCIGILEEAAIDGIPCLVIDPKGDLSNLLLAFPDFRPEDFQPWINEDDARAKGLSPEAYAKEQAALWRKGLAEWGQDGERIRRLRESADFAIYTPGSNTGLPVSVLRSFAPPPSSVMEDTEALREQITATSSALLGLLGIEADPLKSREHILVSTLLGQAWKEARELDLASLIQQIQSPPVTRIGVLELEAFYPAKERFALAMAINNLLASPGFDAWLEGEPLEVDRMLHTPEGRPRVSIFSLAHLGDAERMFFVSFLLNRTIGWMRTQSGTTSLRALLYMDEIFGYFPPVANPPSKPPLLTLLKQARAFGLGVVLTTQNPVDLDYKGLSNAGTWFVGRLQTERDKARLLDGLEGAATAAGSPFDRAGMEKIIAGLGSRIFLMNDVHEDGPIVFQTRWTLSYLRGPLTRAQIHSLMQARRGAAGEPIRSDEPAPMPGGRTAASAGPSTATAGSTDTATAGDGIVSMSRIGGSADAAASSGVAAESTENATRTSRAPTPDGRKGPGFRDAGSADRGLAVPDRGPAVEAQGASAAERAPAGADRFRAGVDETPPVLPPAIRQFFVEARGGRPGGSSLLFRPAILGTAQVRFLDAKEGIDVTEAVSYLAPVTDAPVPVSWEDAVPAGFTDADLGSAPFEGGRYEHLCAAAAKATSYEAWSRDFAGWLVRSQKRDLLRSPSTGDTSKPGEVERDFRLRLQQRTREARDEMKAALQKKYAPRIAALGERIRRAEQSVDREAQQATQQKMQAAISIGATLLGSFLGRRAISAGTLGRATSAARGVGRVLKESQDIGRAQESVEALKEQLAQLEGEFRGELDGLESKTDPLTQQLETVTLRPSRKDVSVRLVSLVWTPYWEGKGGELAPAWT